MSGENMFGVYLCPEKICSALTETGTRVQNIAGIAFKKDFSQQLRLWW